MVPVFIVLAPHNRLFAPQARNVTGLRTVIALNTADRPPKGRAADLPLRIKGRNGMPDRRKVILAAKSFLLPVLPSLCPPSCTLRKVASASLWARFSHLRRTHARR
jgi:hypothetical protein